MNSDTFILLFGSFCAGLWLGGAFWQTRHDQELEVDGGAKTRRFLNRMALAVTVLSFLVAAVFLIWKWSSGDTVPPFVSVAADVFSFAFLGSLVSFGGLTMVSLQLQSDVNKQRISELSQAEKSCPFISIFKENDKYPGRRPGHPEVCAKCPLGIDRSGRGILDHACGVYDQLHEEWKRTPAGQEYFVRR